MTGKEADPVRLATILTSSGPRLHVRAGAGYVDIAAATGDDSLADLRSFIEAGQSALQAARALLDREGLR